MRLNNLTWLKLNVLLSTANVETAQSLLEEELKGVNRPSYLRRINSRLDRLRRAKELLELV